MENINNSNNNLDFKTSKQINCINDIKHVYYINLKERIDRKKHVEEQLKNLGFNPNRFNATKLPNGALGCSLSHLKLLKYAKENNLDHILIVEDDILFLNKDLFIEQFNKFLSKNKKFDVVLLAGNNMPPFLQFNDYCIKVTRCQTTTGYLVCNHYYDTLINNFAEGINRLIHDPNSHVLYAIDKYWFKLQEKNNWYLITPLTVTQKADYSDIEKRYTNYSNVMLDLDKSSYFQKLR